MRLNQGQQDCGYFKMSLYGDYIKERKGYEIIEDEYGFATYGLFYVDNKPALYIEEIYVKPEHRKTKIASEYADRIAEIAKNRGYNKIVGSVSTTCLKAHESLLVLISYGFKLSSVDKDIIYFVKDI